MKHKYDEIGTGYNTTRKADPYLVERILYLLQPETQGRYLDLGCGTGNYTIALSEKRISIIGIEPSGKMLGIARARNPGILFLSGSAEQIPMEGGSVKGIVTTLSIHHWSDLNRAFSEIERVLEEDGVFVLFTSTPGQMEGYWLNHYFPKMMHDSMAQMPSLRQIEEALEGTSIKLLQQEIYFVRDDLKDGFLYIGKNKPQLYFNEIIRNGISSFSSLANKHEIEEGLLKLKKDIESKEFESIRSTFVNKAGDYIFLKFQKKGSC